MRVATPVQSDQLFYVRTSDLGLGDDSLYTVLKKNRRCQVAQRAAMAGIPSWLVSCIALAHGFSFSQH
jgi:hypothetical protein